MRKVEREYTDSHTKTFVSKKNIFCSRGAIIDFYMNMMKHFSDH